MPDAAAGPRGAAEGMTTITRRAALGALAALPLARPGLIRAQTRSAPIKIGLLSDVGGPYRDFGGPGSKVAAELACEDFGGSVLGRPLQVLQADDQNKADVASALAREWLDDRGVDVLADGASSSAGLAIQEVTRQRKRIYLMSTPASTALIGKQCSPYGFQFGCNTYALAKGVATELVKAGGDSWFFITADYEFGYTMQRDTEQFIKQSGGRVLGSVRAPIGTTEFSQYFLQARSSGAKVVALANGGSDLRNCIKQAAEFGVTQRGQRLATLLMSLPDVLSLGQDTCEGLVLTNSFHWALSPQTRAWTDRYVARVGKPPTEFNAAAYAGVFHWLKAVKAAGSLDGEVVAAKMRETPVNDFYNEDVRILQNGSVPHTMYVWEVKRREPGGHKWDAFKLIATVPSPDAHPPPGLFGCPLVSP